MLPILFHLGPFSLHTYGALVALAFIFGSGLSRWLGSQRHLPDTFLLDLMTVLAIAGILGARLFYVLQNGEYFRRHILEIFKIWEGGLVFYGGFIAALIVGVAMTLRKGLPVGEVADVLAPGVALGQAFGRLGCFSAGCCYGKPTLLPWAVHFRNPEALAPLGIGLHPAQLYESCGDLALAFLLTFMLRSNRFGSGVVFWTYVLLYGSLRFAVEFFRGDDRGPAVAGFFPSQWIAAVAIIAASAALIARHIGQHKHAAS